MGISTPFPAIHVRVGMPQTGGQKIFLENDGLLAMRLKVLIGNHLEAIGRATVTASIV